MLTLLSLKKKDLIFLAVILCLEAKAQPQWGNLQPGPFPIGYRTLPLVDNSRRYFDAGRPLQVYVWYPATAFDQKEAMRYGGYFDDIGRDWGANSDTEKLRDALRRQFKSSALNPSFPGAINDVQFNQILETKIPVKRDARHAAGKFPVILHIHSNGALTQSVMLEYLASHGYIVMSISMYGSSPAFYGRGEGTATELLDLTEDLAFVLGESQKMPNVDIGNTAVVGMLSQIGLTLQSKTRAVKAIACLDCFWNPALNKEVPYYDPVTLTMPILEVVNTDFAARNTFVDSLRHSERYIVRFKKLPHADFYPFPRVAKPSEATNNVNYDLLMTLTANFLDAVLKKKTEAVGYMSTIADAGKRPSDIASFRRQLPEPGPPAEHEFLTWLRYGKLMDAKAAWKQYGKRLVSESNLFFATLFLAKDQEAHAFDVFEMYISAFPASARNSMLYEHLAYSLMETQPHKALIVCEKWGNQFPDSPHGYRAWAEVSLLLGRNKDALEHMKTALRKADGLTIASEERARLLADLQKRLSEMERAGGIDTR